MYHNVSVILRENERLKLEVSALTATVSSLQRDKFQDQVAYQQHIGALKEEISGRFFFFGPIY